VTDHLPTGKTNSKYTAGLAKNEEKNDECFSGKFLKKAPKI